MGLEVKRALLLHSNKSLTEAQLFNKLIDLVMDGNVDSVLRRVPAEYLHRFSNWLDRLPPIETLRDVRTGASLSEEEKKAIRAIREWFQEHQGERVSEQTALAPSSGSVPVGPTQPLRDWSVPIPDGLVWVGEPMPGPPFVHVWPKKGGGGDPEQFRSRLVRCHLIAQDGDWRQGRRVRSPRPGRAHCFSRR